MSEAIAFRQLSEFKAMRQLSFNSQVDVSALEELIPGFLESRDFTIRTLSGADFTTEEYLAARSTVKQIFDSLNPGGFAVAPEKRNSLGERFDNHVTEQILEIFPMSPVEAASNQAWSYITLRVLPDFAIWRWPNSRNDARWERYMGGRARNAFQHLWWRSYMIGSDNAKSLTEDEMVQMFERGKTIGSSRLILQTMSSRALELQGELRSVGGGRSALITETAKRIKREAAVVALDLMPQDLAAEFVRSKMDEALEAFRQARIESGTVATPSSLRRV